MEVKRTGNKEAKNEITFDRLGTGEFFEYKKQPYIKINSSDAYCFTDDTIYNCYWGNEYAIVTPILNDNCKFTYKI